MTSTPQSGQIAIFEIIAVLDSGGSAARRRSCAEDRGVSATDGDFELSVARLLT
jgi:hypothetical protein